MGIIKVLDKDTVNKIAAGEVIENPAAVVKELVENSIDADSNSITVEIKEGGTQLIRVTDNGKGIGSEDIKTAFLPHATSKIRTAEDLFKVSSLGFRGEALASIASVSKVELLSKTSESLTGVMYVLEGGEEKEFKEIGVPDGTTFVVKDIFYNTPARKKFLKSPVTEGRYILEVMEHMAVSYPHVAFKFISNGQLKFQTVGNGKLKDVLFYMYGKDVTLNILELPLFQKKEGYSVEGFIGRPALTRGNREYENYFINGRYIKNKVITKAIEDAYKPFIMGGKYPFTCLMLDIDYALVDVNVHPSKLEVRFFEAEAVYQTVFEGITNLLSGRDLIPDMGIRNKPEKKSMIRDVKKEGFSVPEIPMPEPFENERAKEWKKEIKPLFRQESFVAEKYEYEVKSEKTRENSYETISEGTKVDPVSSETDIFLREQEAVAASVSKKEDEGETDEKYEMPSLMKAKILPDIKLIGQVFGTYWIIQYGENVYMIDQHAAHEKVMFERLLTNIKNESVHSQNLFPPVILSFSESQKMVYEELKEEIARLGFEIDEFGGNEYAIKAVPSELYGLSERDALMEILDEAHYGRNAGFSENTLDKIATRACKAAIKGNNVLSAAEALQLIKDLMTLENPYNCPHGRPTMIFMSKAEIEKKFKRQV